MNVDKVNIKNWIKLGPILGLWGLAVTINILIKYKWVDTKLNAP